MKKTLFLALVIVAQIASAQREVKRLSEAEARERVKSTVDYIEKLKLDGKSLKMSDPKIKAVVDGAIKRIVGDAATLSTAQSDGLLALVNLSPSKVLPEVKRLTSIVQAKASTDVERSQAKKTIELISSSAYLVDANQPDAVAKTEEVLKVSNQVASIATGDLKAKSAKFVERYERALVEGKSLAEAVKIASDEKFTLKELLECGL